MGLIRHRLLAPAPPRPPPLWCPRVSFYDLPAELRIEIYKLSLEDVKIKIRPLQPQESGQPHPLTCTSRQVRNEVLPMIHAMCPIRCEVHNFDFEGLLLWLSRIPPHQEINLCKNNNLTIRITTNCEAPRSLETLRRWLHMRADPHRPQPTWRYSGPVPASKVCADLRRRARRMRETGKLEELLVILRELSVPLGDELTYRIGRPRAILTSHQ